MEKILIVGFCFAAALAFGAPSDARDDFDALYALAQEDEAVGDFSQLDMRNADVKRKTLAYVVSSFEKGFRPRAAWALLVLENAAQGLSAAEASEIRNSWPNGPRGYALDLERHVLDLELRGMKFAQYAKTRAGEYAALVKILAEIKQRASTAEGDLKTEREKLAEADVRIADMKAAIGKLNETGRKAAESLAKLDGEIKAARTTIAARDARIANVQKELGGVQKALADSRAATQAAAAQVDALVASNRLVRTQMESAQRTWSEQMETTRRTLTGEVERERARVAALVTSNELACARQAETEKALAQRMADFIGLTEKFEALQREHEALQKMVSPADTNVTAAGAHPSNDSLALLMVRPDPEKQELEKTCASLKQELAALTARYEALVRQYGEPAVSEQPSTSEPSPVPEQPSTPEPSPAVPPEN